MVLRWRASRARAPLLILDQNVGLINPSEILGYCGGDKNLFRRLEKRFFVCFEY